MLNPPNRLVAKSVEKALYMAAVQKQGSSVVHGLLPFSYSQLDPLVPQCDRTSGKSVSELSISQVLLCTEPKVAQISVTRSLCVPLWWFHCRRGTQREKAFGKPYKVGMG